MSRAPRLPGTRRRLRLLPSAVRAGALLGLIVASLGLYALATAQAFAIRRVEVSPLHWTDRDALLASLGALEGQNAFRLSTQGLAGRLVDLPAVREASIGVVLPDTVVVTVAERTPILAWRVGGATFLVDRDGTLFALATASGEGQALPVIIDARLGSSVFLAPGRRLDAVDMDAATRLASLRPVDVGSGADGLVVRITDADGWVLTTRPASWSAVFGSYGHVVRTPDLIPGQVRLLRSLLAGREAQVARVVLADDRNGTYLPLPTGR